MNDRTNSTSISHCACPVLMTWTSRLPITEFVITNELPRLLGLIAMTALLIPFPVCIYLLDLARLPFFFPSSPLFSLSVSSRLALIYNMAVQRLTGMLNQLTPSTTGLSSM